MVFAGESITCHGNVAAVEATRGGMIVGVDQRILVGDRVAVAPAFGEVLIVE
jgi:hypothetical protein